MLVVNINENKNEYPLTTYQKDIWLEQNSNSNKSIHNIGGYYDIKGQISYEVLKKSFNIIINSNDILRVKINERDGEPYQEVMAEIDYKLPYQDFSDKKDPQDYALNWMQNRFVELFKLDSCLYYFSLINLGDNKYFIFFKVHHLIADGFGASLIYTRVVNTYNELLNNDSELAENGSSYLDFIEDNQNYLNSGRYKKDIQFWKENQKLHKPLFDKNYKTDDLLGGKKVLIVKRDFYNRILDLCDKQNISMFHFMLGIMAFYFSKICQREEIVIGVPIRNRTKKYETTIGHFANIIPIKVEVKKELIFSELTENIKQELRKCYRHVKISAGDIYRILSKENNNRESNLCDISLSYENHEFNCHFANTYTKAITMVSQYESIPFAMFIREFTDDEDVRMDFCYQFSAFKNFIPIDNLLHHFEYLLGQFVDNFYEKVSNIELLPPGERKKILEDFNDTKAEYPKDKTVHELFEEQVEKTPDNTAVVFEDQKLTYRELNKRANQLARVLREKGVKQEKIVGMLVERSLEMIVGIMGILKAGGTYLPIDPKYPDSRINYMLEDSDTNVLLSSGDLTKDLNLNGIIINLEDDDLYQGDSSNLQESAKSDSLAYVIYTSGTMGKPKGVMIEHSNLNNLVSGLKKEVYSNYKSSLNVSLVSPYTFDASVKQIFPALLLGHKLFIVPEDIRIDGNQLLKYYTDNSIDLSDGTPTHLKILAESTALAEQEFGVKEFLIGGEELTIKTIKNLEDNSKGVNPKIRNVYGPTECCDITTSYLVNNELNNGTSKISIGCPISNVKVYILNNDLKPVPVGVKGEIYIAGGGVGRGYLKRKQLTEEKFIDNPFAKGKMYRTGDLGRWLVDGNIEFLGRKDYQVKIRGYRIELGAIEKGLLKHSNVKEAVVIARGEDNNKHLCAYIVLEVNCTVKELRQHLSKQLPNYMIPSYFMKLDEMPLTHNGKVDRAALPETDGEIDTGVKYEVPGNEIEEKLVKIWEDLLQVNKIGIRDNFFELGGDSLKIMRMIPIIQQEFNVNLKVSELFEGETIADVAFIIQKELDKVVMLEDLLKDVEALPK